MSNPNRLYIFVASMAGFIITQVPIERFFQKQFDAYLIPTDKFPLCSPGRTSKAKMLGERVYRLMIYLFLTAALFYILLGEDCDFLDVRLFGN
jgi:hypothetical protein